MKLITSLLAASPLIALSFNDLPSFDKDAAIFVGVIVAVVVIVVIAAAILTPVVAIQAGATLIGTAITIGVIALVAGVGGGAAAGFYQGKQADIRHGKQLKKLASQSNQLHISFVPVASDKSRAADFECNLVTYKEIDLDSRPPEIHEVTLHVTAVNSSEFYALVEQKLEHWFNSAVLADRTEQPRRVTIFMTPDPGEGVYERLRGIVDSVGSKKVVIQRIEGAWESLHESKKE